MRRKSLMNKLNLKTIIEYSKINSTSFFYRLSMYLLQKRFCSSIAIQFNTSYLCTANAFKMLGKYISGSCSMGTRWAILYK